MSRRQCDNWLMLTLFFGWIAIMLGVWLFNLWPA